MNLPKKGEKVPIDTIYNICREHGLWNILGICRDNPPTEPFISDG
jgi:hypothetical protein